MKLEIGECMIDHNWTHIDFKNTYDDAIVICQSVHLDDSTCKVVRVRDVMNDGCDMRYVKGENDDAFSSTMKCWYMVIESGYHSGDGYEIYAGRLSISSTYYVQRYGNSYYRTINLPSEFTTENFTTFGQITTAHGTGYFQARVDKKSADAAQAQIEAFSGIEKNEYRPTETVDYLVISSGLNKVNIENHLVSTGETLDTITSQDKGTTYIDFTDAFDEIPIAFAQTTSRFGSDGAMAIVKDVSESFILPYLDEEIIQDDERRHRSEDVSWIAVLEQDTPTSNPIELLSIDKNTISGKDTCDMATVTFKSLEDINTWEARATKDGVQSPAQGAGSLVGSGGQLNTNETAYFEINDEELINGDGLYRIDIYKTS